MSSGCIRMYARIRTCGIDGRQTDGHIIAIRGNRVCIFDKASRIPYLSMHHSCTHNYVDDNTYNNCLRALWQAGKTRWLTLKLGNHQIIGRSRSCGTPGCRLPDWHSGPHTFEKVLCRSDTKPEFPIRRSPRFIHVPFPWHALGIDLQALVLLQLSRDTCELLAHLARLARVIRPMREVILRAMQLDEDVAALCASSLHCER